MKNFEDFQIASWLSDGLLTQPSKAVDQTVRVAKDKLGSVLKASLFVASAAMATIAPAYGAVSFAATPSNVFQVSSVRSPLRVVDQELAAVESELERLRARLSSGDYRSKDTELLGLARQARERAAARSGEDARNWAENLIKSQFV